jgi:hypothetical protein
MLCLLHHAARDEQGMLHRFISAQYWSDAAVRGCEAFGP